MHPERRRKKAGVPVKYPSPCSDRKVSLTLILIRCEVPFALLHIDAIAFGQLVAYPLGDVLGRRVAGKHFIQVGMVELRLDAFLDELEVNHHPVLVEFACLAIDRNGPVVAMKLAAFAGIRQLQSVAG